jgi:hypothetical protein
MRCGIGSAVPQAAKQLCHKACTGKPSLRAALATRPRFTIPPPLPTLLGRQLKLLFPTTNQQFQSACIKYAGETAYPTLNPRLMLRSFAPLFPTCRRSSCAIIYHTGALSEPQQQAIMEAARLQRKTTFVALPAERIALNLG